VTGGRDELLALDAEAREIAQTRFDRPLLVEAGAGTGKTALLAARVVAWCVGEGWERHAAQGDEGEQVARRAIERVVAITFTEAAAAEMASRVGLAFSRLADGDTLEWIDLDLAPFADRDRLLERCGLLADEVHRLQAQTIHSFCHRLLRAFPLEGGLHPSFEVDGDGRQVEAATAEVVENALRRLARTGGDPDWERLGATGIGPPRVAEALGELVRKGVTAGELETDPLADDVAREAVDRLRAGVRSIEDAGGLAPAGAGCGPVTDDLCAALLQLRTVLDGSEASFDVLAEALSGFDKRAVDRLRRWAAGELGKKVEKVLGDDAGAVTAAAARLAPLVASLAQVSPGELTAARRVLASLLADLEERLRALAGWERVRREVRSGIDQLLVDEFQDTDDVQCEIVRWLALDGPTSRRPGLFIVGDPKQSIYGWRRADLGAYQDFKKELEENLGILRPLVSNFRSVKVILDEVQDVVEKVMVEEDGVQPRFEPLEATGSRRTDTGFLGGVWTPIEYWAAWPCDPDGGGCDPDVSVRQAVEVEARALAADLRGLHEDCDVRWGDIGVLLRTTTAQEEILDRFREMDIPFEVAREREYYRQREVVEAASLVRCVLDPSDRLALLTVLRSDVVGVPDAALAPLWDAGLPRLVAGLSGPDETLLAELSDCIAAAAGSVDTDLPGVSSLPSWQDGLRSAVATIADLRGTVHDAPPDLFVERLRCLWLAEVTASARYLGRFRRARLERFFDELTGTLADGDGGFASVARFLRRAVEEGRESQVPAEPDMSADAVHVMTIHGAKGLDFEHVYLVQIHRKGGGGSSRPAAEVIRWRGDIDYRLFGNPTPGWFEAQEKSKVRERAEWVRLLYVAMTRAKSRLVVSGKWHDNDELVAAGRADCFADLVAHRADAEELIGQAESRVARRCEPGDLVQWVLPDVDAAEPERGESGPGLPKWLSAERAAAETERLVELRRAADERRSLPLAATATGLAHRPLRSDAPTDDETPVAERDAAMAVGTAVHGLLETIDLAGDLGAQVSEIGAKLADRLDRLVTAPVRDEVRRRFLCLVRGLESSKCLRRLGELSAAVVARELPLLMPPAPEDPVLGAVVGTADLVYRENGGLVVADYKTDAVETEREIEERTELYRPQLELYAKALEEALGLDELPAMELWFLAADRIVRV